MKSRHTILGICLVAVFVACTVASATASAAAPEFFHCVKLTSKTGEYTSSTCALASKTKTGEFEKKAVPAKSKIKFTDSLGPTRLYMTPSGSYRITCSRNGEGGTATGEVTGPKEVTAVQVTFNGCKGEKGAEECPLKTPGATGAEEIVMNALSGELGKVAAGEAGGERGLDLKPTTGTTFFQLVGNPTTCVPETFLEGSVIGEVAPVKIMATTGRVIFGVKGMEKNKQVIQNFEGGLKDTLYANLFMAGFESTNWLTFEEALEVT
jgi:hypothetical protein